VMLVLVETAGGYALFNVLDKSKLQDIDKLYKCFETSEAAQAIVKLKAFSKFEDTTAALTAAAAICEETLADSLKTFLQENIISQEVKTKLAVADSKMATLIKSELGIKCVFDSTVMELMRGIRQQLDVLLGIPEADRDAMRLGLSHSLCRYKLKFSPDKVDTMIIQAISLLDELDKELNTYTMRVREWYGWHFPEMGRIITDGLAYAKTVKKMGVRTNAATTDLSDLLPEDKETEVKEAAEVSMGTEVAPEDIENIQHLCDQVISITEYRASLFEYLKHRMTAIAPNLTLMVGELVGARLIAHAGSLLALAKHPASTVQILGAEKALFRALKTKHDTPKYGLIYHASLVGQAPAKFKGKISRILASKTSLCVRTDALGDTDDTSVGIQGKAKVESRLHSLEEGSSHAISGTGKGKAQQQKYEKQAGGTKPYNVAVDNTLGVQIPPMEAKKEEKGKTEKKMKKEKKKRKRDDENGGAAAGAVASEFSPSPQPGAAEAGQEKKKKKKKEKKAKAAETTETPDA